MLFFEGSISLAMRLKPYIKQLYIFSQFLIVEIIIYNV